MVTSDLGACEWLVWDLRRSGLIDRGPLDQIVGEFLRKNPRAEAPALAEYLVHVNHHRPHRTPHQAAPLRPLPSTTSPSHRRIQRRDRLGGLIHEYAQIA